MSTDRETWNSTFNVFGSSTHHILHSKQQHSQLSSISVNNSLSHDRTKHTWQHSQVQTLSCKLTFTLSFHLPKYVLPWNYQYSFRNYRRSEWFFHVQLIRVNIAPKLVSIAWLRNKWGEILLQACRRLKTLHTQLVYLTVVVTNEMK